MRTKQILINLLSNAIKFSKPEDTIVVEISEPRRKANGKHNFEIIVTDQGIGLNDEDRQNLFQPFFRSSDPENQARNISSNGIGLNFSKKLASLLGGNLTLSDSYRKGC